MNRFPSSCWHHYRRGPTCNRANGQALFIAIKQRCPTMIDGLTLRSISYGKPAFYRLQSMGSFTFLLRHPVHCLYTGFSV